MAPPSVDDGRTVVGVLLPVEPGSSLLEPIARIAEVRTIHWTDTPEVHRAKAEGSRGSRWIRAHEEPLDDRQREDLAGADVLLALDIPIDTPALAPRLRFVQGVGAGIGQLVGVLAASPTRRVRLCSAAGLSGDKVAEFVLGRLLGVWTDLRRLDGLQRSRRWAPGEVTTESVAGRSLLVVGTGGIGQEVARRAAAFGMRVVGVRRRPELGAPPGFDRVAGPAALLELLGEADAVVLAAPATPRTRQLIGQEELAAMRPGALLCNVARGSLVDEDAVVAALGSGHLGAAVLDVFEHEPLRRGSPLWRAPRAFLSPHVANAWRPEYLSRVVGLLAENLELDRRGLPLRNLVDLDEGY